MAYENRGTNLPGIVAAADYSAAQHRFVSINGDGKAELTGAGLRMDACLENNPLADHAATLNGPGSVAKIEASAAIAQGADVASAADGKAVLAASGNYIAGKALNAVSAAGELVSVWFTLPGRAA